MTSMPTSIWQIIADIQNQKHLSLEKTEAVLNQKLMKEFEQSNEYTQMYSGKPIQLAQSLVVATVDLRLPRSPSRSPGSLVLNLERQCLTLPQVKQRFPILEITEIPRGGSWEEATSYTSRNEWGQGSFGFKEKNPDCLSYVVLKANK